MLLFVYTTTRKGFVIFNVYKRTLLAKIVSNFTRLAAREITYNNFEISLVVFMPNIITNHAITCTNKIIIKQVENMYNINKKYN